ncbi:type III-B CRISPR module-associated Cmr3 family protein, partial [Acidilobus sp.]|uniref:type III-B CRISPR module-associated Cmr3 family protein n=1 Tax=Acidilobus sp. TaxID=1872109 RepID=UPI003CFE5933
MTYLLIRPLAPAVFRWGGLSSVLLSGSMYQGYFEAMPLPSTIYGFLKLAYIVNGLGDDAPHFRGPMFYAEGSGESYLCAYSFTKKGRAMLCSVKGSDGSQAGKGQRLRLFGIEDRHYLKKIGIALDKGVKATKEGYIYMEKDVDLGVIARDMLGGSLTRYGILVEVYDDKASELNNYIGAFGGESRPARVEVVDDIKVKEGALGLGRVLISPAIVDSADDNKIRWGGSSAGVTP